MKILKFWFGVQMKLSLTAVLFKPPKLFLFLFLYFFFFLGNKQSYWVLAFRTEHFRSCFLDSSGNLIFGSFLVLLVLLFLAGGAFYFFTVQFDWRRTGIIIIWFKWKNCIIFFILGAIIQNFDWRIFCFVFIYFCLVS